MDLRVLVPVHEFIAETDKLVRKAYSLQIREYGYDLLKTQIREKIQHLHGDGGVKHGVARKYFPVVFKLAKTRLADRDSKQAVTHRNKIKLLYSKQQKYDDLQKRIKFENNGEANFGVDFKNRIIFVDRLYESKDFNELSFDDLSDVEIDQQNPSNIGFIRKDGSIIQATFTKFPVSKEEKSLDNIMLKNLALKIKDYLSSPITE